LEYTDKAAKNDELLTIKFRYKHPKNEKSNLIEKTVKNSQTPFDKSSENLRFASAVISYGMLLRESKFNNYLTYDRVIAMAKNARGKDEDGYRAEFISLLESSKLLSR